MAQPHAKPAVMRQTRVPGRSLAPSRNLRPSLSPCRWARLPFPPETQGHECVSAPTRGLWGWAPAGLEWALDLAVQIAWAVLSLSRSLDSVAKGWARPGHRWVADSTREPQRQILTASGLSRRPCPSRRPTVHTLHASGGHRPSLVTLEARHGCLRLDVTAGALTPSINLR